MFRFYCTVCKRQKRVRVMPKDVFNPQEKEILNRTGTCRWHRNKEHGMTHKESIGSKRVHHLFTIKSKTPVASKTKNKKG